MTENARQKAFLKRTESLRNKLKHNSHTTNSTNAILCFSDDTNEYITVAGYPWGYDIRVFFLFFFVMFFN